MSTATATATTSLTLATQKPFGTLNCDFYKDNSGEFFMTREQIGQALEYANAGDSIRLIHKRYADRLDPLSSPFKLNVEVTNGDVTYIQPRDVFVYTLRGVMEICRFSRQPKADKFMDFVWDVMESLYNGNSVLAAPDQQTAVSTDTFKLMVDTLTKTQETTNTLIQSFIEEQKDSRTAMATMMNTMSLLANHILEQNRRMLSAQNEPVAESEAEEDPAVDAEFKATPAKDTLPDYKELKPRKNRSEWRTDTYSTIDKIIANQPGKYTERSDVLKLIYNKMNADYGFVIDEERIKYRRRHPYIAGKIWVISMVEENTQWREIFDIILEDVYNDSILHCVKDNPKVKYDKNGLAEFDANSFGADTQPEEPSAKPKIKWLRSTTANPENGNRIDTAVKSVADATNDRTAHYAASYHLIYDEMKPNFGALFTAFQEKFGVKANLRRELFINSDSLTNRFVFAADAVVTKCSQKDKPEV